MQRARGSFAVVAILVTIGAVAVHLGSEARPAPRAYVGQESCMAANCHEGAYGQASSYQGAAKFRETIHQKIHLRPTPETVIIDNYFEEDSVVRFKPLPDSVAPNDIIEIAFDSLPTRPYYDFSDHSFRVIRPDITRKPAPFAINGMPSTCALSCHRNGRGQRNFDAGTPTATSFGTNDTSWFRWKDNADLDLADSLWFHYKRMYAKYLGGVKESDATDGMTAIRSAAWDGTDAVGNAVVSGLYLVRLTAGGRAPVSMKLPVQR